MGSPPDPAAGCRVTLLVPHARRTAVLVSHAASSARLPTVRLTATPSRPCPRSWPADVVDTATTTVLRLVVTTACEPSAPGGARRRDHEAADRLGLAGPRPEVLARLEPATSRAAVAAWARERVDGWSPLRPPWSRPGWFDQRLDLDGRADGRGRPPGAAASPAAHQLWGVSVVLRASSTDGDVFLKCSADLFRHEAIATRALAERMPGTVPEVIAVDADGAGC